MVLSRCATIMVVRPARRLRSAACVAEAGGGVSGGQSVGALQVLVGAAACGSGAPACRAARPGPQGGLLQRMASSLQAPPAACAP
jgi:hypothetical protein